jgi:hypothetical protein
MHPLQYHRTDSNFQTRLGFQPQSPANMTAVTRLPGINPIILTQIHPYGIFSPATAQKP